MTTYDIDDAAAVRQEAGDTAFRAQLIRALEHPDVLRALERAGQAAHEQAARECGGKA